MLGALLVAISLIVVLPVIFWIGLGLGAWVLGWSLKDNAEQTHPGSELIETNY